MKSQGAPLSGSTLGASSSSAQPQSCSRVASRSTGRVSRSGSPSACQCDNRSAAMAAWSGWRIRSQLSPSGRTITGQSRTEMPECRNAECRKRTRLGPCDAVPWLSTFAAFPQRPALIVERRAPGGRRRSSPYRHSGNIQLAVVHLARRGSAGRCTSASDRPAADRAGRPCGRRLVDPERDGRATAVATDDVVDAHLRAVRACRCLPARCSTSRCPATDRRRCRASSSGPTGWCRTRRRNSATTSNMKLLLPPCPGRSWPGRRDGGGQ